MKPVAEGLDYVQGENYMYYGYLLPTINQVNFHLLSARRKVITCKGLVGALMDGITKRFGELLEDRKAIIAMVYLPAFKTFSMDTEEEKTRAKSLLVEEATKVDLPSQPVSAPEPSGSSFFPKRPRVTDTPTQEVERFLADSSSEIKSVLNYKRVAEVFRQFNTPIPSSAPTERMFSTGKAVFRSNRHRMKDTNFEMAMILKINGNK